MGTGQHLLASPERKAAAATQQCPGCKTDVPIANRFCGACGTLIEVPAAGSTERLPAAPPAGSVRQTMFFGTMQKARARLVLIKGDGADGVSFTLAGEDHSVGREEAAIRFDEDPFMSPVHANFFYRDEKLVVRDENSQNGIFLRIRGKRSLKVGDRFTVGEQTLEVSETPANPEPIAAPDGTYYYASPPKNAAYRLVQILQGGQEGLAIRTEQATVTIGRTGNDLDFPDDPFISGRHTQITIDEGQLEIADLDSRNGTFLKVNGEQELQHGDYVFMGQQLLRIEIV